MNAVHSQPATAACVVGAGAVTPVGLNALSSAAAVRAGIANFSEHPSVSSRFGESICLASVPTLDSDCFGMERFWAMAVPAIKEAVSPILSLFDSAKKVPLFVAAPAPRPGVPSDFEREFSCRLNSLEIGPLRFPSPKIAPNGHALGLMALETATKRLASRQSEFCLVGGVDSYADPMGLSYLDGLNQLHVSSNAWGFLPGEAAAFILVCSENVANAYSLDIIARVVGTGSCMEPNPAGSGRVCLGSGLTEAINQALGSVSSEDSVDYAICDQNGEAFRADEHGFAISRISERFSNPSEFLTPADCWGDVGAASGPLFVILAAVAACKGYAKGPLAVVWTSSESGERSAALVQSPKACNGII